MSARALELLFLLSTGILALASGTLVHPFGNVKQERGAISAELAAPGSPEREVLDRACASCHSGHVKWPWYSYVAPMSWLVERDVHEARAHMNLSNWAAYTEQERRFYLAAMGSAVRTGDMPPKRFTLLHPEAALTDAERKQLYEWTRAKRKEIKAPPVVSRQ